MGTLTDREAQLAVIDKAVHHLLRQETPVRHQMPCTDDWLTMVSATKDVVNRVHAFFKALGKMTKAVAVVTYSKALEVAITYGYCNMEAVIMEILDRSNRDQGGTLLLSGGSSSQPTAAVPVIVYHKIDQDIEDSSSDDQGVASLSHCRPNQWDRLNDLFCVALATTDETKQEVEE